MKIPEIDQNESVVLSAYINRNYDTKYGFIKDRTMKIGMDMGITEEDYLKAEKRLKDKNCLSVMNSGYMGNHYDVCSLGIAALDHYYRKKIEMLNLQVIQERRNQGVGR